MACVWHLAYVALENESTRNMDTVKYTPGELSENLDSCIGSLAFVFLVIPSKY